MRLRFVREPAAADGDGALDGSFLCASSCWKNSKSGFGHRNKAATPSGLTNMKVRTGATGKAQVDAQGNEADLPMPVLGLTLPVMVQFVARAGSTECWRTTDTMATVNDSSEFSAKGP